MIDVERLADEHGRLTRRFFLQLGTAGIAALRLSPLLADDRVADQSLADAIADIEYLTRPEDFRIIGRGDPPPHTLPPEKLREVGLHPDTWQLEVVADPDSNSKIEKPMSKELGTAFDWKQLMQLARSRAVRFLKVVCCTNGNAPFGMGLWEGVPLRDLIWLVQPTANIRRVFYDGYHNDDPKQRFQSSLPIGRVLEDPPGEQPVILCYKLNGQLLSPAGGGPVRMVVPDAYGNKSIKWLQRIVLTNNFQANDTYAERNNDTVSHLKTCAHFLNVPKKVAVGQPIPVTGIAQVGMSGLSKVQYWLHPHSEPLANDDPYFAKGDWKDARVLPPPSRWGGGLDPARGLSSMPSQFDPVTGKPRRWPLRDTIVHWATLLTDIPAGRYDLRCRTIDANGIAQPMPRPFPKSGRVTIKKVSLTVRS